MDGKWEIWCHPGAAWEEVEATLNTPTICARPRRTCQEHLQQLQVCRNETFPALGGEGAGKFWIAHDITSVLYLDQNVYIYSITLVEKILHPVFTYALYSKNPQEPTLKWCAPKFVWGVSHRSSMLSLLSQQNLDASLILPSYCYGVIH